MKKTMKVCSAVYELHEMEITYTKKEGVAALPVVTCSRDLYMAVRPFFPDIQLRERAILVCLDKKNAPIGVYLLSVGSFASCVVDPKMIFMAAAKSGASSLILVHNHPSGNLKPSQADRELADKIETHGRLIDLPVLDFMIISADGYLSFADDGLMNLPSILPKKESSKRGRKVEKSTNQACNISFCKETIAGLEMAVENMKQEIEFRDSRIRDKDILIQLKDEIIRGLKGNDLREGSMKKSRGRQVCISSFANVEGCEVVE